MSRLQRSDGMSLVNAIFILVVVASAGAFMLTISGVSRQTASFAHLGPRAYHSAKSGLEWAAQQAVTTPATCPTATFTIAEGGLSGFDVEITCTKVDHVENATTITVFQIRSKGSSGTLGDRDYVSRTLDSGLMVEP